MAAYSVSGPMNDGTHPQTSGELPPLEDVYSNDLMAGTTAYSSPQPIACSAPSEPRWATPNNFTCSSDFYYESGQHYSFPGHSTDAPSAGMIPPPHYHPGAAMNVHHQHGDYRQEYGMTVPYLNGMSGSSSALQCFGYSPRGDMENQAFAVPEGVKMPQRKGGMQLWQFLYSLLTDPNNKYSHLIEWTANHKEREFRLLQPEAIAIWWGHHKNKENMSYDKLSRSLRYYYDKGLLRKIPGERFVYRFCINPETMYKHIGNSESRPKLKPMPQTAKDAITKPAELDGEQSIEMSTNPFVALPPVSASLASLLHPVMSNPLPSPSTFTDSSLLSPPNHTTITRCPSVEQMISPPNHTPITRCLSAEQIYSNGWDQPISPTSPHTNYSVSPADFRLSVDDAFYSPHSSTYGSPPPVSPNPSSLPAQCYNFSCEGSITNLPPTIPPCTSLFSSELFFPPSTTSNVTWAFAQE